MVFLACGLNHKTASLELREQLTFHAADHDRILHDLTAHPGVNEAAILSTCNRTEIYCDTHEPAQIAAWLASINQLSLPELTPHLYSHQGQHGIRHTLRVAAGLDSMMLGEPQILGQLKQAYQQACQAGTVKQQLRAVFEYVFGATKRVRYQSGIGNNPVSIAFAAVQLMQPLFNEFANLKALIIGSGETASLVAKYLSQQGVHQFMIASRNPDHAGKLANGVSGIPLTIQAIPQYLPQADIVVSATACPLPFISKSMVESAMLARQNRPLFFLDLAVPRDIEKNVAEISNVHLYNIDDLQQITDKGKNERRAAAHLAESLIDLELDNYQRQHRTVLAKALICDYREQMQDLAQLELQRAIQKLTSGQNQHEVLQEFTDRLVNKLTHAPTVGIRLAAAENRGDLLDLAQYLFNSTANTVPYEEIT